MLIRLEGQVPWRAQQDPESKRWVGVCDALGVTAEGETWRELVESSQEIIDDLFGTLFAEGTLAQFLEAHGWRPVEPLPASPPAEGVTFDVAAPVEYKKAA